MTSYQHDSSQGMYEAINGNGTHPEEKSKSSKKLLITGAIVVIIGLIFGKGMSKPAGASTETVMKTSGLPLNADGSVMLFDKLSKLRRDLQYFGREIHDMVYRFRRQFLLGVVRWV